MKNKWATMRGKKDKIDTRKTPKFLLLTRSEVLLILQEETEFRIKSLEPYKDGKDGLWRLIMIPKEHDFAYQFECVVKRLDAPNDLP